MFLEREEKLKKEMKTLMHKQIDRRKGTSLSS
jgi:hypothetical protein